MKKRNTAIRALSVFLAYAMVCTSVPAAGQEMFESGVNRETEENTSDLKEFQSSQADEFGTDTGSDAELFGSDDAKQEFQDGENSEEGTDGIRYIKGRLFRSLQKETILRRSFMLIADEVGLFGLQRMRKS